MKTIAVPAETQHCKIEHALRMYNRLDDYLLKNRETITIGEALRIKYTMDGLYTQMIKLPNRSKSNP